MKKKLIITIIALILTTIITYTLKQIITIKNIKNNYTEYAITINDTNLYKKENKEYKEIGKIYKDTYLELEQTEIKNKNDKYFKIKDTDYYILYTEITKTEKQNIETKEYYKNIGKEITLTPTLYKNETKKIEISEEQQYEVIKQDENYYYINSFNNEYQIKKEEITNITDKTIENTASYISVINYKEIKENCETKECITTEELKKQLNIIKENNYYTITKEDFQLWIKDNINLKENAILITSDEDLNEISKEYNLYIETDTKELNFIDTNQKSKKQNTEIPRYTIINKTTEEQFKNILKGEPITYIEEKPLKQQHTLPSETETAKSIAVLNYHFFYDPEKGETCPDNNCKKTQDFERELNYLKNNNYKTLTMEEFTKWMNNEIELPARSVLITIDDGAMGTGTHNGNKLIPLLEKYETHATLFLITGWWQIDNYKSNYLDIESHTHNMHEGGACQTEPRGSKLLCSSKEQILEDLRISSEITGSKKAFCFPMYVSNEKVRQALSEIGFNLAFVGGDVKATRNIDKYKIPRYHIYENTTLDQFINMIS